MTRIKTIDAEVAGEAVRLIVSGGPSVPGRTMAEKHKWLRKHGDGLRRLLMLEPRGHAGMHGAMLTEPSSETGHAGLLFMHAAGFPQVSGEGIIGAVAIGLENTIIDPIDGEMTIETPVGFFQASPRMSGSRVAGVGVTGVPSFVHSAGVPLRLGARTITVDIAFGGEFYAIADSEATGIPVEMANEHALIRMGREIKKAVESTVHVRHPHDSALKDIQGTIFTGAPRSAADLRSATVLDGAVLRRSAGVTGTAALMAVLDSMGVLGDSGGFTHEGLLGTTLRANIVRRQNTGDVPTVVSVIEGAVSITGFHEFVDD